MERLLKSKLNSRKEQVAALGKQLGTDISGSQVQRVHYALNW
jgi:predicted HAD superfamily phosphohydrolase YqeG